ncbi:MAG TPA: hypothetical protein VFQ61_31830 [Polyangiaceae bacterium]|nr:hypothetical protein [Polyangiaceae bacterium]
MKRRTRTLQGTFVSALLGVLVLGAGCSGDVAPSESAEVETATQKLDIIETVVKEKYLDPVTAKNLKAVFELGKDVADAFTGFGKAVDVATKLAEKLGFISGKPDFEAVMLEQLKKIQEQIQGVLTFEENAFWLESEQTLSGIYNDAQAVSESTRDWVVQHPGQVLPLDSPLGALATQVSKTATANFAEDVWYRFPDTKGRHFEFRFALPRFTHVIAMRLGVLAATTPDFVQTGSASVELLRYHDALGRILAEMERTYISCYSPQAVPIPQGSDPSSLITRRCANKLTGTDVVVSTVGTPGTEAPIRGQLLDELGAAPIRELRERLFQLATNAFSGSSACSGEGGTCLFAGVQTVRYGALASYYFRNAQGSIPCNNGFWGDPVGGTAKSCAAGPLIWSPCGIEGENCFFPGPKMVRYGANGAFKQKFTFAGVGCTNPDFGGDPIFGVQKSCSYTDPIWTKCADEGGQCALSGKHYVRYGHGSNWAYRERTGNVPCNNGLFGDPAPNVEKVCEVAAAF